MRAFTPAKKHHHGHLRPALIKAGLALLEDGGIEALTLRKCAAKAGVSHAAPAHHFDGLPGLKKAIAAEAFQIFSSHLQKTLDTGPQTPRGRLNAMCRGYVQFGQSHRGLLAVIFDPGGLVSLATPDSADDQHRFPILRDVCAPFVPKGHDPRVIETQVWSLIHGFTLLAVSGAFDAQLDDSLLDQVMALLDGIAPAPNP